MRRILIPLDESAFSEAIIPDARRLAGPDGTLVLSHVVTATRSDERDAAHEVISDYLTAEAAILRAQGGHVEVLISESATVGDAIEEAVNAARASMIAASTHGRYGEHAMSRKSIAWSILAHSTVPVLLKHIEEPVLYSVPQARCILVPLDGSVLAESALPLAEELCLEWNAVMRLVQVVPTTEYMPVLYAGPVKTPYDFRPAVEQTRAYLERITGRLSCPVETQVLLGSTGTMLVEAAVNPAITDVVMASHGYSGLSRVVLGSVAAELVHRTLRPIIVVPALAQAVEAEEADLYTPKAAAFA